LASAIVLGASAGLASQQRPVFRAQGDAVAVSVSVKNGNVPVAGLNASDFRVFDNNVPQTISDISIEGVPVDLTLFFDTSTSFMGNLDSLKADLQRIVELLRAQDRMRLLVFDDEVEEVVPWSDAGVVINLDRLRNARVSSVYDGLAAAMMYEPASNRRHLIVAMTDGMDFDSAVSSVRLLDISAHVEGVLHLIIIGSRIASHNDAPMQPMRRGPDLLGMGRLRTVAERTGGQMYTPLFGTGDTVKTFTQVFDDFRASYVLRYMPAGVSTTGWHDLKVEVPSMPKTTIRARLGYSGSGQ
jgi:VWFA-related protein